MFAGLTITAVTAWIFSQSTDLIMMLISETGFTPLGYVVMFAPLAIGLVMQLAVARIPLMVLMLLFVAYAVLLGMSLSFIFLIYSIGSIAITFGVSAATFGAMALLGYTTKQDLTSFGRIMYMGFIGIFIAGMVNFFMKSETMDYVISMIGIVVFTGLTAYKMQELKYMGSNPEYDGTTRSKLALIGGLILYILFINIFLSLLRFMGSRE
jgi:FtsH-binding integral membrane protein